METKYFDDVFFKESVFLKKMKRWKGQEINQSPISFLFSSNLHETSFLNLIFVYLADGNLKTWKCLKRL